MRLIVETNRKINSLPCKLRLELAYNSNMSGNGAYHDRSVLIHGKFKSDKWDFQDHILPPVTTAVCFRLRSADRGAQGFQQFANPNLPPDTPPI